ncbi:hypothetical protein LINPERHAP1_LOCUS12665 [Linum perenne]
MFATGRRGERERLRKDDAEDNRYSLLSFFFLLDSLLSSVVKEAKTTDVEGADDSGPTIVESSRQEVVGSKIKQGFSFHDTIMGNAAAFPNFWEDEGLVSDDSDDDGEDDVDCPMVRVPKKEKGRVRCAWASAIIFRTLGKAFPYKFVVRRIQQLWAKKGFVHVWDIGFGHYVARFMSMEDFDRALNNGPWLIGDHYVISEPWIPSFEPGLSSINKLRVWIRLPNLPLECFDESILTLNFVHETEHDLVVWSWVALSVIIEHEQLIQVGQ